MIPFVPEPPNRRAKLMPVVLVVVSLLSYVVSLLLGLWPLPLVVVGVGLGVSVGWRMGWRSGWACWERPYARMNAEIAEQALATAPEDLPDDVRNALREWQEFSVGRAQEVEKW